VGWASVIEISGRNAQHSTARSSLDLVGPIGIAVHFSFVCWGSNSRPRWRDLSHGCLR